jgi:hypothetical protein
MVGGPQGPAEETCVSTRESYNAGAGLSKTSWTARSRAFCSGDWAHLGRQTESETVPSTPKIFAQEVLWPILHTPNVALGYV